MVARRVVAVRRHGHLCVDQRLERPAIAHGVDIAGVSFPPQSSSRNVFRRGIRDPALACEWRDGEHPIRRSWSGVGTATCCGGQFAKEAALEIFGDPLSGYGRISVKHSVPRCWRQLQG